MVIQNWTSVIVGSLQNLWTGAVSTLGNIIGALIVLIIGLVIATALGMLVERIFRAVKLDKLLGSLGLREFFDRAGLNMNGARFLGRLVYWFFVVVFVLAVVDILRFYSLSNFLREVLLYIPNVIVAALIMLAAVVVANFLRRIVRASIKGARLHASHFLSSITWWAVVIFGFLAALSQLGIAVSIINALVTGFVAMLAIAGGIAFGLGGKEYAASLVGKVKDNLEQ